MSKKKQKPLEPRSPAEYIEAGVQCGYVIPSEIVVTQLGELLLQFPGGDGKVYTVGRIEEFEIPDPDNDDLEEPPAWSYRQWMNWVRSVIQKIDEQECIG